MDYVIFAKFLKSAEATALISEEARRRYAKAN